MFYFLFSVTLANCYILITCECFIQKYFLFHVLDSLKVLFAKSDAIKCIIDAMKLFPEKEELQMNACSSLFKMASASG